MQITVNLMDLLLALLILVGVTLGIFLIIFFVRLIQVLKNLSRITADLRGPLAETADQLPDLIRKIDGISKDVSDLTKSASDTVPGILSDAKTITGTARAGVEAVGSAAESITSGVSSFFHPKRESSGSAGTIVGLISQILQIVSLFTHREKSKRRKQGFRFGRGKKHRR
jgi:hypothetical protein